MSKSTIALATVGFLVLTGVGVSAVLELEEMEIHSSAVSFTMTLDVVGSSRPPLARRTADGDIVVEVLNCVAGPSLSNVDFEGGLVRAVELEQFKVGGQPALRMRLRASLDTGFDQQFTGDKFILRVTPETGADPDATGAQGSPFGRNALDIASVEESAGSGSDTGAEESPWRQQLLSATLDDLQRELEESRARERAMRQELEKAQRRLREAATPNSELEAEVERYRELVRQLIEQNEDLSRRLIEAQRVDPELEALLTELRASEAELQEQLQVAERGLEIASQEREGLEGRLQSVQNEVGQLVEVNQELSRQKDAAEAALADLRAQQEDSQVSESELSEMRSVEAGLRDQLQAAERALVVANQGREGLEGDLHGAQSEVGQLVEVNRALIRQKDEAEQALADLSAWQEDSQLEKSELEGLLQSAREEIRQLVLLNASLQQVEEVASQSSPAAGSPLDPAARLRETRAVVGEAASPCLRLRRTPRFTGEILNCLPPGTVVNRLEERGGWIRVRLAFGVHPQGWVAAPYLEERRQQTVAAERQ